MRSILAIITFFLVTGCGALGGKPSLVREVRAGGAYVTEQSYAPIGETDIKTTEMVTYGEDGITTRTVTRTTQYKLTKKNVTDVVGLATAALGGLAGGAAAAGAM
jgi:hypothetical protein